MHISSPYNLLLIDHWTFKRFYTTKVSRRIPRCIPSYGINGRESVSGYPNGFRPRKNELSFISDVVRYKTLTFSWNYSQGKPAFTLHIIPFLIELNLGSQAKQYRSKIRLHFEDLRFWFSKNSWNHVYDDALRGNKILQGTRSDPWYGIYRERRYLVSWLYYGGND